MTSVEATNQLLRLEKSNSLINNLSLIPPFSGEVHSTSCNEFLEKLTNLADLFNWSDEERKFALTARTSGPAAKLIKLHSKKSFAEVEKILRERYVRKETPDVALSRFMHYKQEAGVPVQDFYDRACDLALNALVVEGVDGKIADESRKALLHSMLLNNLAPEIRKGVIVRDPKSPEQILQYALLEEKALKSINPFVNEFNENTHYFPTTSQQTASVPMACAVTHPTNVLNSKHEAEIKLLKEKMDLLTTKLDSLIDLKARENTSRSTESNQGLIKCFACNQMGNHFARDCPLNQGDNRGNYFGQRRGQYNNRGNFRGRGNQNNGGNYRPRYYDNRSNDRQNHNQSNRQTTNENQQQNSENNASLN